jgi:pimeloyl-ACP methyl ester carboxylesterase
MLAPIIVKDSGGLFDGFVSLAGSPRMLPEISFDQNITLLGTPENLAYLKFTLGQELAKLDQLDSWTESELLSKSIMGYPAYYLKDMIHRDAKGAALSLDVPMLFLQGSADFQVYADKDYAMWKEILAGKEKVEFKLYDGLNHMFMVSKGKDAGTPAEYLQKGQVSQNVMQDIAEFIKAS